MEQEYKAVDVTGTRNLVPFSHHSITEEGHNDAQEPGWDPHVRKLAYQDVISCYIMFLILTLSHLGQ